jgi:hypothetical protein
LFSRPRVHSTANALGAFLERRNPAIVSAALGPFETESLSDDPFFFFFDLLMGVVTN